jgi:hypothetical protein
MPRPHNTNARILFGLVILLVAAVFWSGCEGDRTDITAPPTEEQAPVFDKANGRIQAAIAVQNAYTAALMSSPDIVGTAIGLTDDGRPAIVVYTVTEKGRALPDELDGYPVIEEVSGVFRPINALDPQEFVRPMKKPVQNGGHTTAQTPPIQLGTTGGWEYDLANGYCCAGTFGSLVTDGTNRYILSNTHVLAMDIVPGGNGLVATIGDPCIHPGLIDVGCYASNATPVATLATLASLPSSNVDAALARIMTGMVRTDGAILEIGTLGAGTAAAYIDMPVKKSGRTTGLTFSHITALNGTVSVQYENECAGDVAFTHTFYGQLMVYNKRSSFLASGDSGSLMVEDVASGPRAVGLLYAGGNFTAVANPIDEVLDHFGPQFEMVGY